MSTDGRQSVSTTNGAEGRAVGSPARVLLVADNRLYRELLASALEDEDGIELAGSAPPDVAAAAADISEPTVVIVDAASVPAPDGIRALARALPEAKLVAIGVPDDEEALIDLIEAGAAGYVTADQPLPDLFGAVEAAASGELQCSPRLSAGLAQRVTALAGGRATEVGAEALTPRQREIAVLIADGHSNKQIARRLSIERSTVKNHVHSILGKLGISRRDQVAQRLRA